MLFFHMATRCIIANGMVAYFDVLYSYNIPFDKRSKLLLFSPLFWSFLKISVFCLKNEYQDMTTRSAKLEFIRYLPDSREKMRRLNFHLDLTSILLHLHKKILMISFIFWTSYYLILSFDPDNWTFLPLIFTEHPTSPCCRICFSPHKGLPMTWVAQEQNKSSIMSFGCQGKALFVYQVDKTLPKLTKRDPSWSFVVNDFQLPNA